MIIIFASLTGLIAGSLAVWTVCVLRGRRDLWSRHLFYSAPDLDVADLCSDGLGLVFVASFYCDVWPCLFGAVDGQS